MTDWSVPAWKREPHLLVGCCQQPVLLLDVAGVFTLPALHAAICENVATGYREHETKDCLDFLVTRNFLATIGDPELGLYGPGKSYPRRRVAES